MVTRHEQECVLSVVTRHEHEPFRCLVTRRDHKPFLRLATRREQELFLPLFTRPKHRSSQGALKPGSVGALLPGNLLSHRKFEVKLGNNARNFLSPQSVVTFLLLF